MKQNPTKALILAILFGVMSFASHVSMAAENAALSQDWRVALPAELPPAQHDLASLDQ